MKEQFAAFVVGCAFVGLMWWGTNYVIESSIVVTADRALAATYVRASVR